MPARPQGDVTRGTTAPNRLRRVDRWITWRCAAALRVASDPLVVDLGFGGSPVTTLELHARLVRLRPDVRVAGVEIDPERVTAASAYSRPGLSFVRGGFELPVNGRPVVVRAMNVLRQYDEARVAPAWGQLLGRLAPDGVLIDGTCDEIGRRATWVTASTAGPESLSFSAHLASLDRPSQLAERLPKALIHRNVPGEPIHDLLALLDEHWARAAPYSSFGRSQRWRAMVESASDAWDIARQPARWQLGELTVPWASVAPSSPLAG
ncbi:MAG: hypothetical protein QOJ92_443 [Frankiales bacterium]|nr:hypothetical protein [Frankiales bacterium]